MKIIKIPTYNLTELCEGGLSRIWQYTHNNTTFAMIGSQDKDTKEDRFDELYNLVTKLSKKNNKITWKYMRGNYVYDDGTQGQEKSLLINNIPKEDALHIAELINQESIIWKDNSFFGFITCGTHIEDNCLSTADKNMNFDKESVQRYGSYIDTKRNKGQGFTFIMEDFIPQYARSSIRNMSGDNIMVNRELFKIEKR